MGAEERELRKFVAARDRGDAFGMRRHWDRLSELSLDRVRGIAYTAPGLFDDHEREEAVSLALFKLWHELSGSFKGGSMGEFASARYTCTQFACLEIKRRASKQTEKGERPFDPASDDADDRSAYERRQRAEIARREQTAQDQAEYHERRDWLNKAKSAISEKHRAALGVVLERKETDADVAARYGVDVNTVHVWRSRAIKALSKLRPPEPEDEV